MPMCKRCGARFPNRAIVGGTSRNLSNRRYCLNCSPFGRHNTRQLHVYDEDKTCKACREPIPKGRRYCHRCYQKRQRDKARSRVQKEVGFSCWRCGYECRKVFDSMEFHHVDGPKDFPPTLSEMARRPWQQVLVELRKCVFLCCRCGREHDVGVLSREHLIDLHASKWGGKGD
jgi:hypothetical protein